METNMETSVTDYAVKLHSIFKKIINTYGEECVEELFPFCIEILEDLNLHIEENEKLSSANHKLTKKCEDLSITIEKVKFQRQRDLEKSLGIEDDLEKELFDSQEKITCLEQKLKNSLNDLSKSSDTIAELNDKINYFQSQFENISQEKFSLQNEIAMVRGDVCYPLQYPIIPVPMNLSFNLFEGLPVQTNLTVHRNYLTPRKGKNREKICQKNVSISLYSDSQGKDLSVFLKSQFRSKNVMLKPCLVKPGAPMGEIVRTIKLDTCGFARNEYVVIIGGSCDVGFNTEAQIISAYSDLLKFKPDCNLIMSTISPRYDLSPYSKENQEIRRINYKIKALAAVHSVVKVLDLGSKHRRFFTADGKSFNVIGKTSIARDIYKIIDKW